MRISAKGRYALSALIEIARQTEQGEPVSAASISDELGVSKIYLEQIFWGLKRNDILHSTKGKNGGYRLTNAPDKITVKETLLAVENGLFKKVETAGLEQSPANTVALEQLVFIPLDKAVEDCLRRHHSGFVGAFRAAEQRSIIYAEYVILRRFTFSLNQKISTAL